MMNKYLNEHIDRVLLASAGIMFTGAAGFLLFAEPIFAGFPMFRPILLAIAGFICLMGFVSVNGNVGQTDADTGHQATTEPETAPALPAPEQPANQHSKPAESASERPEPERLEDPQDDDGFAPEHGHLPQKYMFDQASKIERFIIRKLSAIDGARPWTVFDPRANLNTFTIEINPADKAGLLYSTDFQTELRGKLEDNARLVKAGNGRRYPAIVIPRRKREFISTKKALDTFAVTTRSQTAMMLGYDDDMTLLSIDLVDNPHLLIIGDTGGGKGVCIHNFMLSMMVNNSPDDLQFVRVDPKGLELTAYDGLPHMLGLCVVDPMDAIERVNWLVDEMNRRYAYVADRGAGQIKDIDAWNAKNKADRLPRIVLVFDELKDFFEALNEFDNAAKLRRLASSKLSRLAVKARAMGIHLVLVTQTGDDSELKKAIKGVTTHILFKAKKYTVQQMIEDNGDLARVGQLTGKGHGLMFVESNTLEFQTPSTVIKNGTKTVMDCHETIIQALARKYKSFPVLDWPDDKKDEPETEVVADTKIRLSSDDELYLGVIKFVSDTQAVVQGDIQKAFGIGGGRSNKLDSHKFIRQILSQKRPSRYRNRLKGRA